GIHGANRLGSNSLSELCVFGKVAGTEATIFARNVSISNPAAIEKQARAAQERALAPLTRSDGNERIATLRNTMAASMERGCGIYRTGSEMQATCATLAELRRRYRNIHLDDKSRAWNTEWLGAIELGYLLEVAQAMACSALARKESRGAHQRLDGYEQRDDANYLKHSLAYYAGENAPRIDYGAVTITRSQPGTRAYGAAGEHEEQEEHAASPMWTADA